MQYCAAYPKESPHWDVKLGKEDEEQRKTDFSTASAVQIPISDPIFVPHGPLIRIWWIKKVSSDVQKLTLQDNSTEKRSDRPWLRYNGLVMVHIAHGAADMNDLSLLEMWTNLNRRFDGPKSYIPPSISINYFR